MYIEKYNSISDYHFIPNMDKEDLPEVAAMEYALFSSYEYDDDKELADIFSRLIYKTSKLKEKNFYMCVSISRGGLTEKLYKYYRVWRYMKKYYDLTHYKLGKEHCILTGTEHVYCSIAEIPYEYLNLAFQIVIDMRKNSFIYVANREINIKDNTMKTFFDNIISDDISAYGIYNYTKIFRNIEKEETVIDVAFDGELMALHIGEKIE